MPDSRLLLSTRRITSLTLATLLLSAGAFSCSWFSSNQDGEKLELTEDDDYEYYENVKATTAGETPHPREANTRETRILLGVNAQPNPANITACQESIEALTAEALNQQDMISAQEQVVTIARQDPTLYHWCFYQSVAKMDNEMAANGLLMSDRADVFYKAMKNLWVLARSLDQIAEKPRYFRYLRDRYIEISRGQFGRNLEVVAMPLTKDRLQFDAGKPAGSAPIE